MKDKSGRCLLYLGDFVGFDISSHVFECQKDTEYNARITVVMTLKNHFYFGFPFHLNELSACFLRNNLKLNCRKALSFTNLDLPR